MFHMMNEARIGVGLGAVMLGFALIFSGFCSFYDGFLHLMLRRCLLYTSRCV